jgi:hypothetical protein
MMQAHQPGSQPLTYLKRSQIRQCREQYLLRRLHRRSQSRFQLHSVRRGRSPPCAASRRKARPSTSGKSFIRRRASKRSWLGGAISDWSFARVRDASGT